MKNISAIIIEDEMESLERLSYLLKNHCPQVSIKTTCMSGREGVNAIEMYRPDLVFLDIKLGDMNGFQVLEKIKDLDLEIDIIFTTAYGKYALKAFEVSAIHYLTKPIASELLKEAVERINTHSRFVMKKRIDNLLKNQEEDERDWTMILESGKDQHVVSIRSISYLESSLEKRNYLKIWFDTKQIEIDFILIRNTLTNLQETLKEYSFFRIHKSYLVNVNFVRTVSKSSGGSQGEDGSVVLKDGTRLPLSRGKRNLLIEERNKLIEK